jgi:hypothetical protein
LCRCCTWGKNNSLTMIDCLGCFLIERITDHRTKFVTIWTFS